MKMRCTMLALVLCALAPTAAAAAPGRHAQRSAADTAAAAAADTPRERAPDARDERGAAVVEVARPRHRRHRNGFYFVAGVAHIDGRVESGGLQLDPTGLASLAAMPGPVQGGVESDPSNIIAGMIGFAPAALHGFTEGAPLPAMVAGRSMARLPFDGHDEDNGPIDFMLSATVSPRASNAP